MAAVMSTADAAAAEIAATGRRLYERGILASFEGNVSIRLPGGGLVTTPSGAHKGRLDAAAMVRLDATGAATAGVSPSSELPMHLAIYQERDDVRAIVHAHPPIATGYAVAGRELPRAALAEIVTMLGCVPIADYGAPSTRALADSVREPVQTFDVLLLANHGAVTVGNSLEEAAERMVQLEHFAHIALVAHLLGGARTFTPQQVQEISRLREQAGAPPVPAVCYPSTDESGTITFTREELVDVIADAVRRFR